MPRPRVSVFLGISLDGFIARANGSLDWMGLVETDPPEDTGYSAFFDSIDALVIGRETYEGVLTFDPWPYADKRVVVLTTRPVTSQHGETFFNGSLPELVESLGQEGIQRVYLDGGATVRQGLVAGLVDDMTLSWLPIILGSGRPLFDSSLSEAPWHLESSRSFPSGLVQATYRKPAS